MYLPVCGVSSEVLLAYLGTEFWYHPFHSCYVCNKKLISKHVLHYFYVMHPVVYVILKFFLPSHTYVGLLYNKTINLEIFNLYTILVLHYVLHTTKTSYIQQTTKPTAGNITYNKPKTTTRLHALTHTHLLLYCSCRATVNFSIN
jgi:hypothetical protein